MTRTDPADTARRPNIVFICTDDLGYGDVSCYGALRISTGRIRRPHRTGRLLPFLCTPYRNVAAQYPERVSELAELLANIRSAGGSR